MFDRFFEQKTKEAVEEAMDIGVLRKEEKSKGEN